FERMKSLHEAGAISQQEFDKVELRYDIAQQDFQAARKIVHIVSPINGVVTHIYRKVGETVPMGKPVVRVARLDEVLIKLNIDETQIAGVQNGQEAIVTVAAYPNKEFTGYLENLSLSADPDSRTFQAWVRVDNEEFLLRPGMFAEVELLITTEENVLIVSKDALIEKDNASMVYVVTDQNVARAQEVSIGGNSGTQVRVVSGVLENDRVVVLGHNKLEDGKKVHIVSDTLGC
ncbi:MAG: efflux RND transporter periplasmic adaptor subunit, partial [Aliifodinibius sp.]|nr:efflux RND transporter periplasmic adaptor subunit [candidate division KSB1 bacterium]NIR65322.1 efflux RND transporter periplasmic adaptor subunit [candidate division Zixibacteria bacterium]NIT58642.1 efflux RND transporter periplasmic adaptor subunit [Fodinibius sp.]NIW46377.1 efflux RND transporter periplasmic adaptor subunit [Gammaproteobacteria bacterium]NIS47037.1 efflux RND transporter periplasmic adaptor subunit [candidate division Zixibacteria bacterium]